MDAAQAELDSGVNFELILGSQSSEMDENDLEQMERDSKPVATQKSTVYGM